MELGRKGIETSRSGTWRGTEEEGDYTGSAILLGKLAVQTTY